MVFHDISFVEATPRYEKKQKLAVKIELTDFSVYYTQGAAEAAIAAKVKEGKERSDVRAGAALQGEEKHREGIVKKERLTKPLDGLGRLLGCRFRLHEPEGDHQGAKIGRNQDSTGGVRGHFSGLEPTSQTELPLDEF